MSGNQSFTEAETLTMQVLPRISSTASMIGSLLIVISVCRRGRKRALMYHRILFFMSLTDVANSFAFFLANWPMPPPDGVGNQVSCDVQGWMLQFGLSIPIWNALLAFNFLLRIRYEVPEDVVRRKEVMYHLVAWVWPLATAFACLGLELYNDALLWCWIAPFPSGCGPTGTTGEPCERGKDFTIYQFSFFFGPLWLCLIVVWTCMYLIYQHVLQHEKNMSRNGIRVREKKSKQVRLQALFYSSAFLLTWVFGSVNRLVQAVERQNNFALVALHSFFVPGQGFFNYLVYKFPEIRAWCERSGCCTCETCCSTKPESPRHSKMNSNEDKCDAPNKSIDKPTSSQVPFNNGSDKSSSGESKLDGTQDIRLTNT